MKLKFNRDGRFERGSPPLVRQRASRRETEVAVRVVVGARDDVGAVEGEALPGPQRRRLVAGRLWRQAHVPAYRELMLARARVGHGLDNPPPQLSPRHWRSLFVYAYNTFVRTVQDGLA